MFEVHESAFDMVDVKRTAHATPLPPGSEHKMLYEQLATPLEASKVLLEGMERIRY